MKKYILEVNTHLDGLLADCDKKEFSERSIQQLEAIAESGEGGLLLLTNLSKTLEDDKELRIDNQYYLKNRPVNFSSESLAELLLNIREILDNITKEQISNIRGVI